MHYFTRHFTMAALLFKSSLGWGRWQNFKINSGQATWTVIQNWPIAKCKYICIIEQLLYAATCNFIYLQEKFLEVGIATAVLHMKTCNLKQHATPRFSDSNSADHCTESMMANYGIDWESIEFSADIIIEAFYCFWYIGKQDWPYSCKDIKQTKKVTNKSNCLPLKEI